MIRSLAELKKETKVEGLTVVQSGKREARQDYIDALRSHYLKRDFPNGLPYVELQPMLCFDFYRLHPKQQKTIWKSRDWIAQEKFNGCRLIIHFVKGVGIFAHSRQISIDTYRRTEYHDHLLWENFIPDFSAVIDTEVLCPKTLDTSLYDEKGSVTKSTLHSTIALLHMEAAASKRIQKEQDAALKVFVFDIVNWQGEDLRPKKLSERLTYLKEFQAAIDGKPSKRLSLQNALKPVITGKVDAHFEFPPIFEKDKQAVFDKIITAGLEGIVLKNLNSPYDDSPSRSRYGWVKVKRQVEIDAYISGFERGKSNSKWCDHVATLVFSVKTDKGIITIAKVSTLEWSYRKKISIHDNEQNTVKLDMAVYGQVAHLTGIELSYKARRLMHPRIEFWRPDLKQEDCVYKLDEIEAVRRGATVKLMRVVEPKSEVDKE